MRLISHIHKGHSAGLPGSLMNRVTDEQRKTLQGYHLCTLTRGPGTCVRSRQAPDLICAPLEGDVFRHFRHCCCICNGKRVIGDRRAAPLSR